MGTTAHHQPSTCAADTSATASPQPGPTPAAPPAALPAAMSSSGRDELRIAVVGGSVTGPITALLLARAGFRHIRLFEAAPATANRCGGLIGLEHAALDVLDRLGIDQPEVLAHLPETITHRRDRAGATTTVDRTYPGRNTTWQLLHAAVTARLPHGVLHTGHRVVDLDTHDGTPVLRFADGHTEPADLVVFADGRASTGRALLAPDRRLTYAGYIAHRGNIGDATRCTAGDLAGLTHFHRHEPCPGVQFNAAPVPGGVDWTLYLNATAADYTALYGAEPTRRILAHPHHVTAAARAHVDTHAAVHLTARDAAIVHHTTTRMAVPILDIDPPTRMTWRLGDGHAVLIGDALAPVRPHTARGANNGIEQAAGLAAALTQHLKHGADLPAALRGWERRHLPAAIATIHLGPRIAIRLGLGTTPTLAPAPADRIEADHAQAFAPLPQPARI